MTRTSTPDPRDHLTRYLDDAGSFTLLDSEEERRQTRHIRCLRRARWCAALEETRWTTFCRLAGETLGSAAPPGTRGPAPDDRDALLDGLVASDPDGRLLDALEPHLEAGPGRSRVLAAKNDYVRARNRFMCANLRLVVVVARRLGRRHLALPDRIQEGNLGLMKAIDRFDPERGYRFSTYATWWIRHAVTRALVMHGRTVRIPAHIHTLFTRARRARDALCAALQREPTLCELATYLDAPLEKVEMAIDAMELRAVCLDEPATGRSGPTIADGLFDETYDDWADRIGERIDGRLAGSLIDDLDPMAYEIVVRRFGLRGAQPNTLRALGDDYDLSRERIRQLQNHMLRGLRGALETSARPSILA
jgi:RNA polymerase sigma factor (sigma-70 family)